MRLILASRSPRRAELLRAAGFDFEIRSADVDEHVRAGEEPRAYVSRLARAKADAMVDSVLDRPVLGADTAVVIDGRILGKPGSDGDAAAMLRLLSGRTHEVLTGVALRLGDRLISGVERTLVRFADLAPDEIAWYVSSGEPCDKAGAYAVQGLASRFVLRLEGSYSNVVGLPVALVYELLGRIGARPRS